MTVAHYDEKLFSRVTIEVSVYLGHDPGVNTPDAYEPPGDYLVVRKVDTRGVEGHHSRDVLDYAEVDNMDPDGTLVDAVKSALFTHRGE